MAFTSPAWKTGSEGDKSNNRKPKTRTTAVLAACPASQTQCQYVPAEGVSHRRELGESNVLPSLDFWRLLPFSQALGTILQLKLERSNSNITYDKQPTEDKYASSISFSLLTDHTRLQKAKVPYFYAALLAERDGQACWASPERPDALLQRAAHGVRARRSWRRSPGAARERWAGWCPHATSIRKATQPPPATARPAASSGPTISRAYSKYSEHQGQTQPLSHRMETGAGHRRFQSKPKLENLP